MWWYSIAGLLAFSLTILNTEAVALVPSSSQEAPLAGDPIEAQPIFPVVCNTDRDALLEFVESGEARRVSGAEAFDVNFGAVYPETRAILVDVASLWLDYWNLEFTVTPLPPNRNLLHFEPVGFGCHSCVLVIGSGAQTKCSLLIVESQFAPPPPDGQLALGTFISGGIDGNSGPAKQRNSADQDSTTAPLRSEVQQNTGAPACGLKSEPSAVWLFGIFLISLFGLSLLQRDNRKKL